MTPEELQAADRTWDELVAKHDAAKAAIEELNSATLQLGMPKMTDSLIDRNTIFDRFIEATASKSRLTWTARLDLELALQLAHNRGAKNFDDPYLLTHSPSQVLGAAFRPSLSDPNDFPISESLKWRLIEGHLSLTGAIHHDIHLNPLYARPTENRRGLSSLRKLLIVISRATISQLGPTAVNPAQDALIEMSRKMPRNGPFEFMTPDVSIVTGELVQMGVLRECVYACVSNKAFALLLREADPSGYARLILRSPMAADMKREGLLDKDLSLIHI